ncbi:hypothetical protein [Engelhardtia mirabilis]|uniref:Flagellar biosynthesis protein FlhF n=1 Tax=Engelhardtia mirabilis TaxID=2528011 RepID=A0A518BSQ3_9BACT|nr:Flagellar biosynthesis protein FlhF [Planctomycetes bacterium Pla133]QDV04328.1 Flagellar biosynthesis protein FlhF [Planctomycetes bacterium Pla86]
MQIHRVRGKDLRDALTRAAQIYGEKAAFLSQEKGPLGDVTIAVGIESSARERLAAVGFGDEPPKSHGLTDVLPSLDPGLRDLRRRLRASGCSGEWTEQICAAVTATGQRGTHAIDAAAAALSRQLSIAPAPKATGQPRLIAMVGPTGVGKTTTVAKLADSLSRAGRRIAICALDAYRAGAVDQLRAFADRMEVPLWAPRSSAELSARVEASGPLDAILVDTTGRSPNDARELGRIQTSLAELADFGPTAAYLVLSATTGMRSLERAHRAFARLNPEGLVITKLDETDEPAPAVELAVRARLGVAFLCDGQEIRGHLHRPSRDRLADLVLRGRLA